MGLADRPPSRDHASGLFDAHGRPSNSRLRARIGVVLPDGTGVFTPTLYLALAELVRDAVSADRERRKELSVIDGGGPR